MHSEEEEKNPKNKYAARMFLSEGRYYFRLKRYDVALDYFNKASKLEPENLKIQLFIYQCYVKQGRYDKAKLQAEEILKQDPLSQEALLCKAQTQYLSGDFEKSFRTCRKRTGTERHILERLCQVSINNSLDKNLGIELYEEDVQAMEERLETYKETYNENEIKVYPRKDLGLFVKHAFMADVEFMDKLLTDKSLASITMTGTKESMLTRCQEMLRFAEKRQSFRRLLYPCLKNFAAATKCINNFSKDNIFLDEMERRDVTHKYPSENSEEYLEPSGSDVTTIKGV